MFKGGIFPEIAEKIFIESRGARDAKTMRGPEAYAKRVRGGRVTDRCDERLG